MAIQIFVLKGNKFYIYYLDWIAAKRANHNLLDLEDESADFNVTEAKSSNQTTVVSIAKPPAKESFRQFMDSAKSSISVTQGLLVALWYVFTLTFICYPALTLDTSLKFLLTLPNAVGWFTILMNTLFSIFDTIGRKMGGIK